MGNFLNGSIRTYYTLKVCIPTQARLVRTIPPTTPERRRHRRSSVASIFTWLSANTPARVLKHRRAPSRLPPTPSPTLQTPAHADYSFRLHSRPWLHRPLRPMRALRQNRLLDEGGYSVGRNITRRYSTSAKISCTRGRKQKD